LDGESDSDRELLYDDSEKDDDDDEEDGNEIPTIKSVEEEIKLLIKDLRNLSVEDSGFCKSDDEINNHATDNVNADEEQIVQEEEEQANEINNKLEINLGTSFNIFK
jgi:choline kinase